MVAISEVFSFQVFFAVLKDLQRYLQLLPKQPHFPSVPLIPEFGAVRQMDKAGLSWQQRTLRQEEQLRTGT